MRQGLLLADNEKKDDAVPVHRRGVKLEWLEAFIKACPTDATQWTCLEVVSKLLGGSKNRSVGSCIRLLGIYGNVLPQQKLGANFSQHWRCCIPAESSTLTQCMMSVGAAGGFHGMYCRAPCERHVSCTVTWMRAGCGTPSQHNTRHNQHAS